jgi:hypothetical protein
VLGTLDNLQVWARLNLRWQLRFHSAVTAIALLAISTLGLFEPLASVLHCAFWLPLHVQSTAAAHTQRLEYPGSFPSLFIVAASNALPNASNPPYTKGQPLCSAPTERGHTSSEHHTPLAEPFHEMVLVVCSLAALVPLIVGCAPPPHVALPAQILSPRLRPPIA